MSKWRNLRNNPPDDESIGTIFEFRAGINSSVTIYKVIEYYGMKMLKVIPSKNNGYLNRVLVELLSKHSFYHDNDEWRYISKNEMMAYL